VNLLTVVIAIALFAVILRLGFGVLRALAQPVPEPPPPGVIGDPFLMEGREVFLSRCVPCHGVSGKGDGPMATFFSADQVGDLTDGKWKHGDKPEDVLRVIRAGVPNTRMAPWGALLEDSQIRAVAGYCFALSKLPVPDEFRKAEPL